MVKRKKLSKESESDTLLLDPNSHSFIYDEVDDFNDQNVELDSDLEDDEDYDDSNENVLALAGSDDEDEDAEQDDTEDEDTEDENEDDIHSEVESEQEDERRLGRRKKDFFGTDLTDQRIHKASKLGNKASEVESLELEEESVKRLQERMAQQSIGLNVSDLIPELSVTKARDASTFSNTTTTSKSAKNVISSEIASMAKHVKDLSEELSERLLPLIAASKNGQLTDSPATEYLRIRYFLCLNYFNSISAYMMIMNSVEVLDRNNHPVVRRLQQFRHLFTEMESYKAKFDAELDQLLSDVGKKRKKRLKLVQKTKLETVKKQNDKKVQKKIEKNELEDDEDEDISDEPELAEVPATVADERRLITYQISKNKGLVPYRKKDQRNPRVRYKNKFVNKLKRRKGQVRVVRKETKRYEGEVSGINRNVVKSVRLK